jgi:hypothetical protein
MPQAHLEVPQEMAILEVETINTCLVAQQMATSAKPAVEVVRVVRDRA